MPAKLSRKVAQQTQGILRVYIFAGEASGDLIGSHLMQSLKTQTDGKVVFYGVGGPKMIAEGLDSLFPFYELSMLGAVEVLPYLFNISARIRLTVEDVLAKGPHLMITIDSPGFCFRLVEKLREEKDRLTCKFVHYVAPTVWVYKPERAQLCARLFDHMLVLLPFEPPYFEQAGLPCTWVGHPAIVETPTGDAAAFRKKFDIPADSPLVCMMPGSRKSEVERHMPIFGKAISLLATQFPQLSMVVAVPANIMPYVTPFFAGCPFRAIVTSNDEDKRNAIAASTLGIVKSGTVSLEVARANVPMVVAYQLHPLSAYYLRRKIRAGKATNLTYANLVNILENEEVIPELLQELCEPSLIATAATYLLHNPDRQQYQKSKQNIALQKLIPGSGERPSDIAARTVLNLLKNLVY